MLEYLRNAADKPVAKILIGILAFSFVGWGVAEWIFGGGVGDNTLVRVGGEKITVQEFSQTRAREIAQMSREQQRALYSDPAMANQFNTGVITTLASQRMAEKRADDLGFVVSDNRIANEIRQFPEFQIDGRFSTFAFDTVLGRSGYSEVEFADILRRQILRSMVLGAVSAPTDVPAFAVKAAYNAKYGMREIEYATVKYSDFNVGTPTDEQLRAFYDQNPQVVPEYRTVSYVLVPAKMNMPDEYDAALALAQKVEDDIISGETMATAAARHKVRHVALKPLALGAQAADAIMDPAMVMRVFAMDEGVESELIETKDGFVIVRVEKVDPAHNAEFEAVKKSLVADWRRAEQKKQAYVRANELLVDFNKTGKLGGAKTVTVTRGNGAPLDVLAAAFSGEIGSKTIVPGADAFYVMGIAKDIAPKVDSAKTDIVRREVQNMAMREMMDDYNAFLIRQYPTKINAKIYNRALGIQ